MCTPIYWFPNDNGANDQYISHINQYYQDVGPNCLYQLVASEYAGDNGSIHSAVLANWWEDTQTPYPCQNCSLSKSEIVAEVKLAIATNGWPTSGYSNYFPVYTLLGEQVADPSDDGTCGYQSFWGPLDSPTIYAHIVFPSAGDSLSGCPIHVPTAPSGNIYIDSSIDVSAHEQLEAVTDPVLRSVGWYGNGEIGDICSKDFGGSYPFLYDNGLANQAWTNQAGHIDYYIIQTIASRTPAGCLLGPS
ncbi:MAG TPA: hypothetical protein VFA09_07895 [Ktedonobacteraceae bacterium]|jgi:hypothetical protein|nr:hypothetical protein [Ktedonobacteraceae bacterium]